MIAKPPAHYPILCGSCGYNFELDNLKVIRRPKNLQENPLNKVRGEDGARFKKGEIVGVLSDRLDDEGNIFAKIVYILDVNEDVVSTHYSSYKLFKEETGSVL